MQKPGLEKEVNHPPESEKKDFINSMLPELPQSGQELEVQVENNKSSVNIQGVYVKKHKYVDKRLKDRMNYLQKPQKIQNQVNN